MHNTAARVYIHLPTVMTDSPFRNTDWIVFLPERLYPCELLQAEQQVLKLLDYDLCLSKWTQMEIAVAYLAEEISTLETTRLINQDRVNRIHIIRSLIDSIKCSAVEAQSLDLMELEEKALRLDFDWQMAWCVLVGPSQFPLT